MEAGVFVALIGAKISDEINGAVGDISSRSLESCKTLMSVKDKKE